MFMPKLIQVLFGEAFLEAAKPARWLMVASLFQGTNAVAGNALRAMGRPGGPAMAELGGMILTAALLLLLLPGMGGLGAAIASLLAYALTTSIYAYLLISGLRQGDTPRARPGGRTRGKNEA
jgi:O-antigen/teichoic acid export membrane protein